MTAPANGLNTAGTRGRIVPVLPPKTLARPMHPVEGAAVWNGSEMAARTDWIYHLTDEDIGELEVALSQTQRKGLGILEIDRDAFPLPRFGETLMSLENDVLNGRGFVLIKGLPLDRLSRAEAQTIYWGIGTHLGDAVSQNAKGHVLGHVRDLGLAKDDPSKRGYQTNDRLRYHTDSAEFVGLLCLAQAKSGGYSSIASTGAVHNALLARRPDLMAELLAKPFYVDRRTEVPEGKLPYFQMPVFHFDHGYFTTMFKRRDIGAGQRFPEVPRFTEKQLEALDLIEDLAEELSLKMMIEAGDMQFIHNHVIFHSRTAFEDHPEPERKRHMVRLWLSIRQGRPLPPCFAERYGEIAVGKIRGGIIVPGTTLSAPLDVR
jgi:hypothetical protein